MSAVYHHHDSTLGSSTLVGKQPIGTVYMGSDPPTSTQGVQMALTMPPPGEMLFEELSYYTQNEVPAHLIFIPQRKMVNRSFVEEYFRNHLLRDVYGSPSRWRESLPARPKILGKLIDVTDERQLCRFIIRRTVTYATLSHRWEQAEVLNRPFVPTTNKINVKMRWAALRKTTRAEDSAYSLMSLLGVSMRSAYGEGRTRAFHRLIKAVIHDVEDLSVLYFDGLHLPKSAASYYSFDPFTGWNIKEPFSRSVDMRMGRQGVQLRVLVLPAKVSFRKPHYTCQGHWIVQCRTMNNATSKLEMRATEDWLEHRKPGFFIGIVSYCRLEATKVVALPKKVIAYLLRDSRSTHETSGNGWETESITGSVQSAERLSICSSPLAFEIPGNLRRDKMPIDSAHFLLDETSVQAEYVDVYIRRR
ncbi:hypothetical protein CONPUDRAFT_146392 [Coniophora puteana RWD-64-598 SS2]|uniref:Uncharacterized protein n=1 Tax=Coniophora puteana (strain RWD-64-598) TaxID=741705 RepID=A0A5M3MEI0_CONPW|nr:uncharacterized protein CONPUDRAFT_146392 [Coniophora puteana RWD-64-598 SS2]EIW77457.1 hypothetical protein CONPUDRAFT_146392 [Coniophora puteana RWD-64-598 SS2]